MHGNTIERDKLNKGPVLILQIKCTEEYDSSTYRQESVKQYQLCTPSTSIFVWEDSAEFSENERTLQVRLSYRYLEL